MNQHRKTRIYRIIHIESLPILLNRKGLYAPNYEPDDGHKYKVIHDIEIQKKRKIKEIPVGPKGSMHNYVPFYFGTHSPMLLNLKTNRVKGYSEGQDPLIYLVAHLEDFILGEYVFSDGHGIKSLTKWFDDIKHLDKIDWNVVNQKIWKDLAEDNDRQRRKQAECLIHRFCDWSRIRGIAVINSIVEEKVGNILNSYPSELHVPIRVLSEWFY